MILELNPALLLSQQIALGNFDKIDNLVDAGRFCFYFQDAAQDIISFDWKLFPYEGEHLKDEVEHKMGREGFVPADLEFGLAFGAQMPDSQRESQVILLGAHAWIAVGECMFVCLKGSPTYREIGMVWTSTKGDLYLNEEKNPQFLGIKRAM